MINNATIMSKVHKLHNTGELDMLFRVILCQNFCLVRGTLSPMTARLISNEDSCDIFFILDNGVYFFYLYMER